MSWFKRRLNKDCSIIKGCLFLAFYMFSISGYSNSKSEIIDSVIVKIEQAINDNDKHALLQEVNHLYATDTILPDVSAYYLGYTLYKFEQLESGKNAFLRYVDLTQEEGVYFDSVVSIVNKIDIELKLYSHTNCEICNTLGELEEQDTCSACKGKGIHVHTCHRCEGAGNEVCPTCRGTGYETAQTQFYVNYVTCHTCLGKGSIECSNCQGSTKEKTSCEKCSGGGFTSKERECTHRDFTQEEVIKEEKDNTFSR